MDLGFLLFSKQINPSSEIPQEKLNTFLISAVKKGSLSEVTLLIKKGADVNVFSENGFPVLKLAIALKHTLIAELLIQNGANVNANCYREGTALNEAAGQGNVFITELLIRKGANVNLVIYDNGWSALKGAAWDGFTVIVDLLIQNGADINKVYNDGKTVLMIAAQNGHVSTCFRILCSMTLEEREIFSNRDEASHTLVNAFQEACKENANKIYNVIKCIWHIHPDSIFRWMPSELIEHIKHYESLLQDFPDWYKHRIQSDAETAVQVLKKHSNIKLYNYLQADEVQQNPLDLIGIIFRPLLFFKNNKTKPIIEQEETKNVKKINNIDSQNIENANVSMDNIDDQTSSGYCNCIMQ